MILYFNTHSHARTPLGLKYRQCISSRLPYPKIQYLFRRIAINKDQILDHLVIQALIPYYELSVPKA